MASTHELLTAADDVPDCDLVMPSPEARYETLTWAVQGTRKTLSAARARLADLRAQADLGRNGVGRQQRTAGRQAVQDTLEVIRTCQLLIANARTEMDQLGL